MELLSKMFWENTLMQWLTVIVGAGVCFAVMTLLKTLAIRRLGAFAVRTATGVDDLVVTLMQKTQPWFLLLLALFFSSLTLALSSRTLTFIHKIIILALLGQVIVWGTSVIEFMLHGAEERKRASDPGSGTAIVALGFMARMLLWSVVILLALDNLGVNITALVAGLGVGGIAVALAVQTVLGDLLASLSIVFDKPFAIGDFIVVEEHLGTVEHVGLKTTRIRSLSGEEIIFSNADLLRCRIRNFKRMNERRVVFNFGVTYETPHHLLSEIGSMVLDIIKAQPHTRFDRAHFKEFGDSALIFEAAYYMLDPDYNLYMNTQQSINLELCRRFQIEGIEFAYPTQTVRLIRSPREVSAYAHTVPHERR